MKREEFELYACYNWRIKKKITFLKMVIHPVFFEKNRHNCPEKCKIAMIICGFFNGLRIAIYLMQSL